MLDWSAISYARSGDVAIAYLVAGDGPHDVVFVHGFAGNIEIEAESPRHRAFYERLASFARFITFDRRGTGLSDRPREAPTLETRMDDLRAVLDAVDSDRAVLFGTFEAASMCILFAATYPERTLGLALYNPVAKGTWSPDYPWAPPVEDWRRETSRFAERWGTYELAEAWVRQMAVSYADDAEFVEGVARQFRLSASPGAIVTIRRMAADVDVRDVLAAVRVPALIFNMPPAREEAEYVTARIPGARRFEVPGPDYAVNLQTETLVPELERFVTGLGGAAEPETVLTTVLFTDIVGSTAKAAELGDARWRELVERHHAIVRRHLDGFRGRELDTAGDGFFATFDGPIRAIRCARAIADSLLEIGIDVRAGLHTGECEVIGEKVGGIAVSIGARIASLARPGEVLVSSTVRDLVAGSTIEFEKRGAHELRGVPGEWSLYAVSLFETLVARRMTESGTFDEGELIEAVEIQGRCYRLLLWTDRAIERGFIRLNRMHEYSSERTAAEAWLSSHFHDLPLDCRPLQRDGPSLRRFANYFSSYLRTSFELEPRGRPIYDGWCDCPICRTLVGVAYLKPKKLSVRDKRRAQDLKRNYLRRLDPTGDSARIDELLVDRELTRAAALAAYGHEIIRRCRGGDSGPATLALWREIAWKPIGSPDPKFRLRAKDILQAEAQLLAALGT